MPDGKELPSLKPPANTGLKPICISYDTNFPLPAGNTHKKQPALFKQKYKIIFPTNLIHQPIDNLTSTILISI